LAGGGPSIFPDAGPAECGSAGHPAGGRAQFQPCRPPFDLKAHPRLRLPAHGSAREGWIAVAPEPDSTQILAE